MTENNDNGQGTLLNLSETPEPAEADKVPQAETPAKEASQKRTIGKKRAFPANTLEESLRIAQVIHDLHGGNPWEPLEVAQALDMRVKSPEFYALTASSRDYGLTKGTATKEAIELAPVGHQYVFPNDPADELAALKEAFFKIALFKGVHEFYQTKGGRLPEFKYLQNTLKTQFNLDFSEHEEFVKIYSANLEFLANRGVATAEKPGAQKAKPSSGTTLVIAAEPSTGTKLRAFIAMPFTEKAPGREPGFFAEVFAQLIEPAALAAGFAVETARRAGSDVIHSTIVNELFDADLVIVDLTDHNPNVLFELGVRMAIKKPIALIKARNTGPIFDVDNVRFVEYDPRLWPSTVKEDLPKLTEHIRGTWDARGSSPHYMDILRNRPQQP